jgi:hypothetical protein
MENPMKTTTWETPAVTELRMDAEIGSYQDDFDPSREVPAFVEAGVVASHDSATPHSATP